ASSCRRSSRCISDLLTGCGSITSTASCSLRESTAHHPFSFRDTGARGPPGGQCRLDNVRAQSTEPIMITGMHAVIYTRDAEADRAFFRDVLGLPAVDVGGGWLIFAAPPSEVACHPAESNGKHELYLMCDDVKAEIASLC